MPNYSYYDRLSRKTRLLNLFRRLFRLRLLERWLSLLTYGESPRCLWGRLVPPEYTYPAPSWREVSLGGVSLKLDLSNVTDHDAFYGFRDEGYARLRALLKPHFTIVDIGGNIGIRALDFACVASSGLVVTFEPDPDTFQRLKDNVYLNPSRRIVCRNVGIGVTPKVMSLYRVSPRNSGMNRLLSIAPSDCVLPSVEVNIIPLVEALKDTGAEKVDVIKIDVEGFELNVLNASMPIILRDRPLLFIEVDDNNLRGNESSARDLIKLLESLHYNVIDASDARNIQSSDCFSGCHFDALCMPRGESADSWPRSTYSSTNNTK